MIYSDFHCHAFLRCFEKNPAGAPLLPMPADPNKDTSVWCSNRIGNFAEDLEELFGFIGYTEADFGEVSKNESALLVTALYPVESAFFRLDKRGFVAKVAALFGPHAQEKLGQLGGNIITRFSRSKVKFAQSTAGYSYFDDLMEQINYANTHTAFTPAPLAAGSPLNGKCYSLLSPNDDTTSEPGKIKVVLSIEGGNCLWGIFPYCDPEEVVYGEVIWNGRENGGLFGYLHTDNLRGYVALLTEIPKQYREKMSPDKIEDAANHLLKLIPWDVCTLVVNNLKQLKAHPKRPFFITIGHHFYNGMCGHPKSLQPLTDLGLVNQDLGMNTDITNLGWMVINEMLKDPMQRILVDVKHMSVASRLSYYAFRRNHYPDVPIIFSHGAVYGGVLESEGDLLDGTPAVITNSTEEQAERFYKFDINLFDGDIIEIVNSSGLIGMEIDKRVTGVKKKGEDNMPEMIWYNMCYIAKVASMQALKAGACAWDFISLGTDFDGIINPTRDYKTATLVTNLCDMVRAYLEPFLASNDGQKTNPAGLSSQDILDKIFCKNVQDFVAKYYVNA